MARLIIHQERIPDHQELIKICPFGALEEQDGKVIVNAACKMCRLCVKKGPEGAVEYVEDVKRTGINKEEWKGIAVYADHVDGTVHPVTFELIGKAKEMAAVTGQKVMKIRIYPRSGQPLAATLWLISRPRTIVLRSLQSGIKS